MKLLNFADLISYFIVISGGGIVLHVIALLSLPPYKRFSSKSIWSLRGLQRNTMMCDNITATNTTTPPHHTHSDQPLLRFIIEGIGIPIVGGIGVVGQFNPYYN